MKLGAQLFSLRNFIKTPDELCDTLVKLKNMGYSVAQLSGNPQMSSDDILRASETAEMPIVCTHFPFQRIVDETEAVIAEHKHFNCPVIGIGVMPKQYVGSLEGLNEFLNILKTPVKKILGSGLNFAYHNHDFEFKSPSENGEIIFDIMLRECTDWQFIADTYWIEHAGFDACEYIKKIGSSRIQNIHYKDMTKDSNRAICACGTGCIDFEKITKLCKSIGVINVLVEQDNAIDMPDPFGEMQTSYENIIKLIK